MNDPVFLIVDDDEDDRSLLASACQQSGYSCRLLFAENAHQAWHMLQEGKAMPGLLLLDINMPGMNGLELLRKLRSTARWQALPVLILTTSSQNETVLEAYRRGANSYLVKPDRYESYTQLWKRIYEFWAQTARLPFPG